MAFPSEPLDVQVELLTGSTWTDITADVYTRDLISISRGQPDQGARADPAKCTLTLNNRDGRYSPRNPTSPYYGLIGRNTPIRITVPDESYLSVNGATSSTTGISTPDAAVLDITGDIDVRLEASLDNWLAAGTVELAGKGDTTGNQRSWLLVMRDRRVHFEWSTAGTSTLAVESFDTLPVPPSRRLAIRVTLDVNNGAGGFTATFYTAPSIAGPWTQLGAPVTAAGTTSIFASTGPLQVGDGWDSLAFPTAAGGIHAFQLYNGIAGTLVADLDLTSPTPGASTVTDGTGLVWTVGAQAAITNRWGRFTGEVSSWPPKWDTSGRDVWTSIEAAGILRRLGQGAKALDSTLRRRIPSQPNLLAYWPLEDGASAIQAASPVPGVAPLKLTRVTWASADSLPSSGPLPVLASNGGALADLYGPVPAPPGFSTGWLVRFVYRLDNAPADGPWTFMRILSTGTAREWYIQSNTAGSRIIAKDSDGANIFSQDIGTGLDLFGQWNSIQFWVSQSGSTVTWRIDWQDVGGDAGGFSSTFTGNVGRVRAVASPPDGYAAALDGMALGHIAAFNATSTSAYDGAITAYSGESTLTRMERLAAEETLPLSTFDGDLTLNSARVGPQTPQTLLDLIGESADADGGVLYEERSSLALAYRDRTTLYNQAPALFLDYTAGEVAPPLEPVEDDSTLRNDVTVTRSGGSSARAVLDEGPLSVQAPPNGVGIYDEQVTLNLYGDDQAMPQASWRMHLGTWDEARYPSVTVYLHAAPHLIGAVLALREGDLIRLTNLPAWLAPGDVDLLVCGYAETIRITEWEVTFNCRPAGPWAVGVADDATRGRVDTDGTELDTAAEAADTTLRTIGTDPWITTATHPDEFPFDAAVGGEQVTVTGITPYLTDDFTRTVTGGWGNAATGVAWTAAGGSSSDYSVNGTAGIITLATSPSDIRFQQILQAFGDGEILVSITPGQVSAGGACVPGVLLRAAGDYYRCRMVLNTNGTVGLDLVRVSTAIGSTVTTGVTYSAGSKLWLRVRITGQRVLARTWRDGTNEPLGWALDQTVTTDPIAVGAVGLVASVFGGNTNTSPSFAFDHFQIVSPQLWTVTRAVNGIAKDQPAGTGLRLAHPSIVAL